MKLPSDWRTKLTAALEIVTGVTIGVIAAITEFQPLAFLLPASAKYALGVIAFVVFTFAKFLDFIWKVDSGDFGAEPGQLAADAAKGVPALPSMPVAGSRVPMPPPSVTTPARQPVDPSEGYR